MPNRLMCVVVEQRGQSKLRLAEAVEYARLLTAGPEQAVAIAMAMRGLMPRFYFNVRVGSECHTRYRGDRPVLAQEAQARLTAAGLSRQIKRIFSYRTFLKVFDLPVARP